MRNFLYVFILVPFFCHAQPGHYYVSHFSPSDRKIDHVAFDMVQDANGFVYFATRAGILQYDGTNWNLIQAGGAVYAIEADQEGNLYWGGSGGFGALRPGVNGAMQIRINPASTDGDVFSVTAGADGMYFLTERALFVLEGDSTQILRVPEQAGAFTSVADVFGNIFVSTERMGVLRLEGRSGFLPARFGPVEIRDILFSSMGPGTCLVGTSDNRLFTCNESLTMKEILSDERDLLAAGSIVEARWVNERLIAVATLRSGILFADPLSGQLIGSLNYNTGLPDNEVYALYVDRGGNVWAAHDYGMTRIAPQMPFRDYSNYEGIQGNLLCVETFNDDVYVGTSVGLFTLMKEAVYEEITWYEPAEAEGGRVSEEEPNGRRRGLFSFLRRKENRRSPDLQSREGVQRTARVLKSERYVYKPVAGIAAKVSGLTRVDDRLVASGLGGVFEVDGIRARPVLKLPVRSTFATRDGHLVVSAYDNRLILLKRSGNNWKQADVLENPDEFITQVFQHHEALWLCGTNAVYQTTIEGDGFSDPHAHRMDNPGFSRTIGFVSGNVPVFVNGSGFFCPGGSGGALTRIDSLPAPYAYFASPTTLWYSDGHSWNALGERRDKGIGVLRLLGDIRSVNNIENSEDLWIINGNDVLYRLSPGNMDGFASAFPLLLHSVTQGDRRMGPGGNIVFEQDSGPVVFHIVRANYLGAASSEYRYFLSGISADWSEWSTLNNQVTIPYLPPGSYTLQVESRDILGTIHEMTPVSFRVRPLFWKSTWFYAMELAVFALLGWLSLKLSFRYRLVSRVLALLTIILLIEFVQTLAGHSFSTSSPLADFLLQVVIAFLILPIESYLRRVMFRGGKRSRLIAVIDDLDRREKGDKKMQRAE